MKLRPILFSATMVNALLAGTKTQTRRVCKPPKCATLHGRRSMPEHHHPDNSFNPPGVRNEYLHWAYGGGDLGCDVVQSSIDCPYGAPGDQLWVRESFAPNYFDDGRTAYMADFDEVALCGVVKKPKWTPSIFMRPTQSRITLEITSVRAERLQSIVEDDARTEGVDTMHIPARINGKRGTVCCLGPDAHRAAYRMLWDAINGRKSPWTANPWVWVVEFRRVKP